MVKNLLSTIIVALFCTVSVQAQNLVPNPSFESYNSCPTSAQQWYTCNTWVSPTPGTPDYFNSCSGTFVGVPTNWAGNQTARTGNAYGRTLDYGYQSNYGEYIQVQLSSPMVSGQLYNVEYYVSLCDNQQIAHTGPEMYISNNAITGTGTTPRLPYVPQIKNPTVITSKTAWSLVSGTYTALGGERYITMGLFTPDNTLATTSGLGGSWPSTSYYIDDVSVTPSTVLRDELLAFSANVHRSDQVIVQWELAETQDTDHLVVEKSLDGENFVKMTSFEDVNTSYALDDHPAEGDNFYRLKVVAKDGASSYSDAVLVPFTGDGSGSIAIAPNPVSGQNFAVSLAGYQPGAHTLSIYDLRGSKVFEKTFNAELGSRFEIGLDRVISPGLYIVKVHDARGLLGLDKVVFE